MCHTDNPGQSISFTALLCCRPLAKSHVGGYAIICTPDSDQKIWSPPKSTCDVNVFTNSPPHLGPNEFAWYAVFSSVMLAALASKMLTHGT
ncbi:hypothetical protein TrVGV298_011443 [Trichoderma virens]|nr:hypothetical protein TrVGV298_011443 [Trichoderma virens]